MTEKAVGRGELISLFKTEHKRTFPDVYAVAGGGIWEGNFVKTSPIVLQKLRFLWGAFCMEDLGQ